MSRAAEALFWWSGKELWKPMQAHHKIFEFSYIHDYDVIIIVHERARFKYWHAIAADECLS